MTTKAHNLINEINSILNEDAYSKYKPKQLYMKLGVDGFAEYLEKGDIDLDEWIEIFEKSHSKEESEDE
jgi:hypothetical protein